MTEVVKTVFCSVDISSGNQALVDDPQEECARILEEAAEKLRTATLDANDMADGILRDINGNKVGDWHIFLVKEVEA